MSRYEEAKKIYSSFGIDTEKALNTLKDVTISPSFDEDFGIEYIYVNGIYNKGKNIGRPKTNTDNIPAIFYKHYPAYAAKKMNVSELARVCKLSRPTVYKYLKLIS